SRRSRTFNPVIGDDKSIVSAHWQGREAEVRTLMRNGGDPNLDFGSRTGTANMKIGEESIGKLRNAVEVRETLTIWYASNGTVQRAQGIPRSVDLRKGITLFGKDDAIPFIGDTVAIRTITLRGNTVYDNRSRIGAEYGTKSASDIEALMRRSFDSSVSTR
ncbi:MAG: hypothetical protein KGH50_04090, partial [Candidatus Micrarchaeota archaeon]|nr:hypothetical protein [Candidatus Micrarchaeota archaeon]